MAEALTRSYNTHKGHLTKYTNNVKNLLAELKRDKPSSTDLRALDQALEKVLKKSEDLEKIRDKFTDEYPDDMPADIDDKIDAVDDISKEVRQFLRRMSIETTEATLTPGVKQSQKEPKVDETLRPRPPLGEDSNFREYRAWASSFDAFYKANNMSKMDIGVQLGLLKVCLDSHLNLWLDGVCIKKPGLDIKGALEDIKLHFEKKFSLLRRRFDYWSYDRKDSQSIEDYVTKLRTLALEAELDKVKPDDIEILRLIIGCNSSKIREELFKLDEKSKLEDYYERASLMERVELEKKHFAGEKASVHAISAYKAEKSLAHQESVAHKEKTHCLNCDSEEHRHFDCDQQVDYKKVSSRLWRELHPSSQPSRGGFRGRGNNHRGRGGGNHQGGDKHVTSRIVVSNINVTEPDASGTNTSGQAATKSVPAGFKLGIDDGSPCLIPIAAKTHGHSSVGEDSQSVAVLRGMREIKKSPAKPTFHPNQKVVAQDPISKWWTGHFVVIRRCLNGRSYRLQNIESGRITHQRWNKLKPFSAD